MLLSHVRAALMGSKPRPQANRYVLGVTSLWMLVPGLHELVRSESVQTWVLSLLSVLVALVSAVHWKHCVQHSTLHNLDRRLARVCYVVLCVQEQSYCNTAFALIVFTLYALAQIAMLHNQISLNLVCHLCFRFIGYWWTCHACIGSTLGVRTVAVHSLVYWAHAVCSYWYAASDIKFDCALEYTDGCFNLVSLLIIMHCIY